MVEVSSVVRSEDNSRCLNGGGTSSSRRDDPHRLCTVDIRARRSAAVPRIIASEVRG